VEGWQFKLTTPQGTVYDGQKTLMRGPIKMPDGLRLYPEDNLFLKQADQPIPTGGQRTGWLLFVVRQPRRELDNLASVMELSFADVEGNWYHQKQTVQGTAKEGHPLYYPGFKLPEDSPK
jgi:hypothetical protein